jgi:hypothetical protein
MLVPGVGSCGTVGVKTTVFPEEKPTSLSEKAHVPEELSVSDKDTSDPPKDLSDGKGRPPYA